MRFIKGMIVAALALASSGAYASSTSPGYIFSVNPESNGVLIFNISGARSSDSPGCANLYFGNSWTINGATPAGQVMVAALLTAYAAHKQIFISGKGSCPDWGDRESVDYFSTAYDAP